MRGQSYTNNNTHKGFQGGETKVMKKSLLSLLIFALIFTLAAPAFATGSVNDIAGKTYEEAVKELMALGVVEGYPDGTFKGENTITRAEFAKLVAYASGHGNAAGYFSTSSFKDVPANHWALGYIEVAASQGYVLGDGSGNFMPNANITVEQAVTVLLRVLGYNDQGLKGTWPGNYVLKANQLGMYAKVDAKTGAATRGTVAQLLSNALSKEVVLYFKSDELFLGTDVSLLVKSFGTAVQTGVLQATTNTTGSELKADEVSISGTTHKLNAGVAVFGAANLDTLVGKQVNFIKRSNQIVYIKDVNAKEADGTVKYNAGTPASITVTKGNTTQTFAVSSNAVAFFNGTVGALADFAGGVNGNVFVNSNNQVTAVFGVNFAAENAVITDLFAATNFRDARIVTDVYGSVSVAKDAYIEKNGEVVTFAALAKNDVISYATTNDVATYIVVASDKVQGKVTRTRTQGGVNYVTVDGKEYVSIVSGAINVGTEYTFLLNVKGEITKATPVTTPDTVNTGMVIGKYSETVLDSNNNPQTKHYLILDVAGAEKVLEVTSNDFAVNSLVRVTNKTAVAVTSTEVASIKSVTSSLITYTPASGSEVTYGLSSNLVIYVITEKGDLEVGVFADIQELVAITGDNAHNPIDSVDVHFVTSPVTAQYHNVTYIIIDHSK